MCHSIFFGLPGPRSVLSMPNFFTIPLIQRSEPNGVPLYTHFVRSVLMVGLSTFLFRIDNDESVTAKAKSMDSLQDDTV